MVEEIIGWLIIGLSAALIANIASEKAKWGIYGTMLTGLLGSFVGGALGYWYINQSFEPFHVKSFITAAIGAAILLFGYKLLFAKKRVEHIQAG